MSERTIPIELDWVEARSKCSLQEMALGTEEQCLAYFERRRWPNGVRCLTCGNDKISKITRKTKTKNKRAHVYQCLEPTCKQQFSCTTGTIFHDSHLPLSKWFMAVALIVDAKKGMSALQLQRHLGCNYRTAWYLAHRIREAMDEPEGLKLTGTVEVDETYIGGRQRGHKSKLKRLSRSGSMPKTPFLGHPNLKYWHAGVPFLGMSHKRRKRCFLHQLRIWNRLNSRHPRSAQINQHLPCD